MGERVHVCLTLPPLLLPPPQPLSHIESRTRPHRLNVEKKNANQSPKHAPILNNLLDNFTAHQYSPVNGGYHHILPPVYYNNNNIIALPLYNIQKNDSSNREEESMLYFVIGMENLCILDARTIHTPNTPQTNNNNNKNNTKNNK